MHGSTSSLAMPSGAATASTFRRAPRSPPTPGHMTTADALPGLGGNGPHPTDAVPVRAAGTRQREKEACSKQRAALRPAEEGGNEGGGEEGGEGKAEEGEVGEVGEGEFE